MWFANADEAEEYSRGYRAGMFGKPLPDGASKAFAMGWHKAREEYYGD